ncbi:MAG: Mur ligase family protein [Oscillospiraceae bacterium]|nr:Mur ligase family protein [Oscillospiraceae bacterium]
MGLEGVRDFFEGRRILILGFGREGRSSLRFLRNIFPREQIGIADKNLIEHPDQHCVLHCGEDYLDALGEYDIVVKSPGISFAGVEIPQNVQITCQTEIFLRFCPCKTVGITGTKGKTTTSTLIYEFLRESGINTVLAGNMGLPVLDEWREDDSVFVLEMSSHQLEFTRASPHIAVWTNLYPEHLDHYATGFEGYVKAKLNILRYQKKEDFYVFYPPQEALARLEPAAQPCPVALPERHPASARLRGKHNLVDFALAAKAAELLGATQTAIARVGKSFRGVPHRLEPIATVDGVTFVDDTIATIPAAALSAIDTLENCKTLIFGGQDRGIDYGDFAKALAQSDLRTLIAMPDTGEKIIALGDFHNKTVIFAEDMPRAVAAAFAHTRAGETCLLSPAAPSYNAYRDFEAKAKDFRRCIDKSPHSLYTIRTAKNAAQTSS